VRSRGHGPPEDDAARTVSPNCPGPSVKGLAKTHTRLHQGNATPRQCGDVFREGFARGFRDGVRMAMRRLPPETWPALEALSSEFDLAGGDG
jgi:hypothetical protein